MRKLVLSLMLVVVAAIFGLGWGLDRLFERLSEKQTSDEIGVLASLGSRLAQVANQLPDPDAIVDKNTDSGFTFTLQPREEFPLPVELVQSLDRGEALVLESEDGVSLHYLLPDHAQILSLQPELPWPRQPLPSLNLLFTIVFYTGILLFVLLWIYPLVSRLLRLRSAARKFGEGDLAERIKSGRYSYIRDIENEFNRMADRIQTLISDNKLLASAVSHDLRTPLARLRFGIDTLAETEDPTRREQYSERIGQDLDEMERLVSTLLAYARLDQSMEALERQRLNLAPLIGEACEKIKPGCTGLEWQTDVDCAVEGDGHHLWMMINNLVQNACKYGRGQVRVSLQCVDKNRCRLVIEDNGDGIAEQDRDAMLKPFVRGEGHAAKGYGMGLAIVSRIAVWHKAELSILPSEDLGGAKIQLDFRRFPGE